MNKHTLPEKLRGIWTQLERDYRTTTAALHSERAERAETGETYDAYTAAVDAILMTPAETVADIRLKIEVIRDHEVFDNWWCAAEAAALLAIDAGRLLPDRKGGVT